MSVQQRRSPRSSVVRGALMVALLLAVVGSVGTVWLTQTGRDPRNLWYSLHRVDAVRVVRESATIQLTQTRDGQATAYQYTIPAFDRTGKNTATAQALYDAAFALRVVPPGATFSCPGGIDVSYHLTFLRQGASVLTMTAFPSGCQFLNIGGFSSRFTVDSYWQRLAAALAVPEQVVYPIGRFFIPPDKLTVTQMGSAPGQTTPPLTRTVTDGPNIQQALDAIQSHTAPASSTADCPQDAGPTYRLEFFSQGATTLTVDVQAYGCELVHRSDTPDTWRVVSPGFWPALAAAIGVAPAELQPAG